MCYYTNLFKPHNITNCYMSDQLRKCTKGKNKIEQIEKKQSGMKELWPSIAWNTCIWYPICRLCWKLNRI